MQSISSHHSSSCLSHEHGGVNNKKPKLVEKYLQISDFIEHIMLWPSRFLTLDDEDADIDHERSDRYSSRSKISDQENGKPEKESNRSKICGLIRSFLLLI